MRLILGLIFLNSFSWGQNINSTVKNASTPITIKWVEILSGDFSFTNQAHSIQCEAWCYEWAGTNFIEVIPKNKDTTNCYTMNGIATHCSLHLEIIKDICYAAIDLKSIIQGGDAKYFCTDGYITIDKKLWKKGIMKAEFNFNFEHNENPKIPIYWKGKIYAKIKTT